MNNIHSETQLKIYEMNSVQSVIFYSQIDPKKNLKLKKMDFISNSLYHKYIKITEVEEKF